MKRFLMSLFSRDKKFSKKDVLDFAGYWQIHQSPFGYNGEEEKLFNQWLLNKKK